MDKEVFEGYIHAEFFKYESVGPHRYCNLETNFFDEYISWMKTPPGSVRKDRVGDLLSNPKYKLKFNLIVEIDGVQFYRNKICNRCIDNTPATYTEIPEIGAWNVYGKINDENKGHAIYDYRRVIRNIKKIPTKINITIYNKQGYKYAAEEYAYTLTLEIIMSLVNDDEISN